jgi:hypothetical protein
VHKLAATASGPHALVFATSAATPYDHRNVLRILGAAAKRAGLEEVKDEAGNIIEPAPTVHALRHTNGSALIAAGWDVQEVSARLNHSNPATTRASTRTPSTLRGAQPRAVTGSLSSTGGQRSERADVAALWQRWPAADCGAALRSSDKIAGNHGVRATKCGGLRRTHLIHTREVAGSNPAAPIKKLLMRSAAIEPATCQVSSRLRL